MQSIKIKGKKYAYKTIQSRYMKMYHLDCKNSVNWYAEAYKFCKKLSNEYNIDIHKIAGITAALSPLKSWTENKNIVIEFLNGNFNIHFSKFVEKSQDILFCNNINEIPAIRMYNKIPNKYQKLVDNH